MMKIYYIYTYTVLSLLFMNTNSQYQYYQNQPRYDNYNDMTPMENNYDYDYSNECSCSCVTCENMKPCCKDVCVNCAQQSQSNIVIVPYPYPFIITTKQKEHTTQLQTTEETTAATATTQETEEPTTIRQERVKTTRAFSTISPDDYIRRDAYNDVIAKAPRLSDKNKFVLTSVRRTKSNWMPKYGIVPIPDNLAEKLMLQLRSMRVLHPKKETIREKTMDVVSSFQKE